jgi:hypothetical protein
VPIQPARSWLQGGCRNQHPGAGKDGALASPPLLSALTLPALAQVPAPTARSAALQDLPDTRKRRFLRAPRALVLTRSGFGTRAGATTLRGLAPWARRRTAWRTDGFRLPRPRLPGANPSPLVSATGDLADLNAVLAQGGVPPRPSRPAPPAPLPPHAPFPAAVVLARSLASRGAEPAGRERHRRPRSRCGNGTP